MNKNFTPGPLDEGLRLEAAATTKTASFIGTTKDMGVGFAPAGVGLPMAAVVDVAAGDRSSSDETYTFKLRESDDDSTYTDAGPTVTVTVAGAALTTGVISVPGFISKRYVKLDLVEAGTTPSLTYEAWLVPLAGRP
jgi:hypothetical protein